MNTKRLLDVINWNLTGAKRALRRETAGLIVAPSCIIIANCAPYWINKQPVDDGLHVAASVTWFALFFLGAYWGARFCFNMNTKNNALNYMMLPATNGEKYLANMFMQTIVRMVETAVAIIMADLIQAVICLSVGIDIQSYTMALIDAAPEVTDGPLTIKAFILASIINLHASMVLGGCFFRKNHRGIHGLPLRFGGVQKGLIALAERIRRSHLLLRIPHTGVLFFVKKLLAELLDDILFFHSHFLL